MNKENTEKLFKKYPNIFKQKSLPPSQSLMCFGFECGDGWFDLINNLCSELKDNSGIEAFQVKSKFGGLRFYVNNATKEQRKIIEKFEELSYETCELCGSQEDVHLTKGWITPKCKDCRKGNDENKISPM